LSEVSRKKKMAKLIYEKRGHVAYLTLNRPEAMNAMDADVYRLLSEAWIEVRDDYDIWASVITGAGDRAFSSGADLKTYIPSADDPTNRARFWQTQAESLLNRGLEVWKPVIAAVNGYCLGGGMTLLLATDIRVASENATFGLSEVQRGILPGNGGTQRVVRQLAYAHAMELLLLGDRIDAAEAYRIGLVNRVVPAAKLIEVADQFAQRLCERAPLAVRAIKEMAVRGANLPLGDALRLEETMQLALRQTADAREGAKAFGEKRKPRFTGN
jgi:E-phenylitaconyl-CoA hydratase